MSSSDAVLTAVFAAALMAPAVLLAAPAPGPGVGDVLKNLKADHPRLILTDEVLTRVKRDVAEDATAKDLMRRVRDKADEFLGAEPVERVLKGPRLLSVSREVLDRVTTLAFVYRVTGERRYADRAIREMEAAAGFKDWNPSHFLDVAEMTAALGFGYDWLYEAMTPAQRTTVREAIVAKGLRPGLKCYRGKAGYGWWVKAHHNWNQVCNGGLGTGALAIGDEAPEVAREIVAGGLESLPRAMARFGVDGGWAEGPGYWGYAMRYTARYLDVLRTALGSMRGFDETEGLAETGDFRIHLRGPSGMLFNFADCNPRGESPAPQLFWLARTFDRPYYAGFERAKDLRPLPFYLIWYTAEGRPPAEAGLPTAALFRGVEVVTLRTAWGDRRAAWLAVKGGDNRANHSHLDLGSFVYEDRGVRWALDLGSDDYNLPGYWDAARGGRWKYYRLGTHGHNTLVIDGGNQKYEAAAPIIRFSHKKGAAVADLSEAYPMTTAVRRGVRLADDGTVLVQDEVEAAEPVQIVWQMHTRATVEIADDGRTATLTEDGERLVARLAKPKGARFDVASAERPEPEERNKGVVKLLVRPAEKTTSARIAVLLADPESSTTPKIAPLDEWPKQ